MDVFIAEKLANFESLDFVVMMDPETIVVDFSNIESQLDFEILDQSADNFRIHMTSSTGVDYGQSLFMIPFTGDAPYILLSE
ncbi:hypothetical protein KKG31_01955 [Patescibacteria group bacterium]|nr:hypothetical protein [Patescibacteria group bacterium]MBU1757936.1 hypothetical protein [Patescibacteria group bacterium]